MTSAAIRLVRFAPVPALLALVLSADTPAGAGAGTEQAPAQQAVFRTLVELVRVDVLVTRDGAPVRGLTPADFELRDEGVVQQIVGASLERIPLDVLLVLDLSGSITDDNAKSLRSAALAFLAGLTPLDRAGLLTFTARVEAPQPLTPDLDLVRARLADIRGGGSTALHDAIYTALRLREANTSRAAVVVFTDGLDNISWLSRDEVIEAARRSDVVVHAVVVDRPGAPVRAADNPVLHNLERETGGQVWEADWGPRLTDTFRSVLDDLRSRYVLTYYPTGVPEGGWHKLDVSLKRGGKVRARAGYYRPKAGHP